MRVRPSLPGIFTVLFVATGVAADEPYQFYNRGIEYRKNKQYDKAIEAFSKAIELTVGWEKAYSARADVYLFNLKDSDKAIEDYSKAIQLRDADVAAKKPIALFNTDHLNRGVAYANKGKYGLAIADFQAQELIYTADGLSRKNMELAIAELRKVGKEPQVQSVTLDTELKKVVTKTATFETEGEQEFRDTVTFRHEVSITEGWKAEAEARGTVRAWFAEVQASVRVGIEKQTGRTYGVEFKQERATKYGGGGKGKESWRVNWTELYRTGTATLVVDGVTVQMPFAFREDFAFTSERVATPKK